MEKIFFKLQTYYSHDKYLVNQHLENELTGLFKRELKISTKEANLFGVLLYYYIKDSYSVSIREICEEAGLSKIDYLKIIPIIDKLEKKGLIIANEIRKNSSRIINPDIEIDEIIFRKIIYGEDIFSKCNFKDFYSIIETANKLIQFLKSEKISQKYFMETMRNFIRKINKNITLGKILSKYSLEENIIFFYTLVENFDSWSSGSVSITEYMDLVNFRLIKKMTMLDKIIGGSLPIFKDKVLEIALEKTEELLSSSTELSIRVNRKIFSKLLNRKIRNFNIESELITHKKYSKLKKAKTSLFFNEKLSKEINKIQNFLSVKQFSKVKKELQRYGLPEGAIFLFYGSPGTGKTASVYDIAKTTGRDIMQVNFSQVESKWVGESEKNIKKIFDEYRYALKNMKKEPVLLFNEADALISMRIKVTDSVDQMKNTMQNILLEELENFKGIFIATTNLIDNIDSAFDRRFIYKLKFEKPDKNVRMKIWTNKFNELTEEELNIVSKYELSGGQIENIVKKFLINKIINLKRLEVMEIIEYIKEELQFRQTNKKIVGF